MVGREGQTFYNCVSTVASVPGLPRSVRVLIVRRRQTFENRGRPGTEAMSTVSESSKTFLTVICCSQSMHLSISHSLCSAVHNYDSLCRRSSRSPIMLRILLVIGASVSEPPLVDSTDALSRYIYNIYNYI